MKHVKTLILFDNGEIAASADWEAIHKEYVAAIKSIDHPETKGKLTLRKKEKEGGQWQRNGVRYLRERFIECFDGKPEWKVEAGFSPGSNYKPAQVRLYPAAGTAEEEITSKFGNFDLVTTNRKIPAAIEWETGNISSSHRSMNKLAVALHAGQIQIGVLIVPSRDLYHHLTDRVGNIGELSGYLRMWQLLGKSIGRGLLAITVVEHDVLDLEKKVEFWPVGKDGNSKKRPKKA